MMAATNDQTMSLYAISLVSLDVRPSSVSVYEVIVTV